MGDGATFMVRIQAWRWLAYTMAWKLGTQHTLGYTRKQIEDRFQSELETYYDKVYKPAFVDNDQRPYFVSIRNLGTPARNNNGILYADGGCLGLYMANTLVFMKQVGLWSVMKQKSAKCKAALEMMITCNDKYVIDYIMDTDGRDSFYQCLSEQNVSKTWTTADIPANWAAQKTKLDTNWPVATTSAAASAGAQWQTFTDWVTTWNGAVGEQTNSQHMQYQYLKARKVFFPEYPHARLDTAISKMDGYYAKMTTQVTNSGVDWQWLLPNNAEILVPTVLGPN